MIKTTLNQAIKAPRILPIETVDTITIGKV